MHSKKITVRFASAVSAAVIGFTSTAISFFDCPVYAAYGGAAWGEFFGFYSLLEGFGFGQDNSDFVNSVDNWIDSLKPEEKPREDYDGEWMTDAQYWQQCQYDKFTGWLDNLVDSWSESYDAVGDVGSGGASGGNTGFLFSSDGTSVNIDYILLNGLASSSSPVRSSDGSYGWFDSFVADSNVTADQFSASHKYILYCSDGLYFVYTNVDGLVYSWKTAKSHFWCHFGILGSSGGSSGFAFPGTKKLSSSVGYNRIDDKYVNNVLSVLSAMDVNLVMSDMSFSNYVGSIDYNNYTVGDSFIGPVYTYPAAQELARQNKTSTGIRLDVKTADGVPDVKAALDGAGVSTVDELAASVAAGDVAMQDVFADAKVTPYVVADTASGVVVTDLGVATDAAGVKPVALTKELTVPADLTTAATYAIQGKTWDPDMAKYRLPLFQYFPFCLPWDIYQVLTSFAADPVAPQIEIPIGKFFANKKSFDGSAVANYTATLDLGDEKFSKWFSALRLLESAGIIIGLVLISVHLIHGGR